VEINNTFIYGLYCHMKVVWVVVVGVIHHHHHLHPEWHWWWRSWIMGIQLVSKMRCQTYVMDLQHNLIETERMRTTKTLFGMRCLMGCHTRVRMSKHFTVIHRWLSKRLVRMMYKIWRRSDTANVGLWRWLEKFLWHTVT